MTSRGGPALATSAPISELLAGTAVVALVPATTALDKAAALAWYLARTAANAGRRVALVDCHVDEPQLQAVVGEPNDEGIVDVFEYGASLSRIARQQPEENLYFLPAGTFTPNPAALMGHPRWRRLAAGFRHEEAVMLLFVPAECVGAIAPNLDGLVALAPGDADAGLAATPEIQAAVNRGVPLLAIMTDTEGPEAAAAAGGGLVTEPPAEIPLRRSGEHAGVAPGAIAAEGIPSRPSGGRARPVERAIVEARARPSGERARPSVAPGPVAQAPSRTSGERASPAAGTVAEAEIPTRPSGGRARPSAGAPPYFRLRHEPEGRAARARWGLYAPLLLVVMAAAAVNYRVELGLGDLGLSKLRIGGSPERAVPVSAAAPGAPRLVPHAVDSLPFVVQVSSWTSLAPALDAADALEGNGFLPIISPVRLGAQLWYRVCVGPVATQDAADSLRSAVRTAGHDQSLAAAPVLAPLSLTLVRVVTPGAARTERARLRATGIPAFVLGLADGSYQLFAGAFQRAEQAAYLDSLLTSTRRAGRLGPRVGFRP